jgi:hypothetical protein
VTLLLVLMLGGGLPQGFNEAIGLAVLAGGQPICGLNLVVVARGFVELASHPSAFGEWKTALMTIPESHGNPLLMIGLALLVFPKLALGLSGFETGVAVMPLVRGAREIRRRRRSAGFATRPSCC